MANSAAFLYYPTELRIGTGLGTTPVVDFKSNGNVLIGTSTDGGQLLQVAGTLAVTGAVSLTTPLAIASGGTGSSTAGAGLTALGGASLTANNTFTGTAQNYTTGTAIQLGLVTDAYYSTLSSNQVAFHRAGSYSYIDQLGIGGSTQFRLSTTTTTDTTALTLNTGQVTVGLPLVASSTLTVTGATVLNSGVAIYGGVGFYASLASGNQTANYNHPTITAGTGSAYVYDSNPVIAASAAITNVYHFLATAVGLGSGATLTNAYGLYLSAQAQTGVTNSYGVYQAGASDTNYFGGATTIANTALVQATVGTATAGLESVASYSGTGGYFYGIFAYAKVTGGSGATANCLYTYANIAASTSASYVYGLQVSTPALGTSATVANCYGVYVAIQAQTGITSAYGIYQAGASDINVFAGNVAVAGTTARQQLSVGAGLDIYSGNANTPTVASIRALSSGGHLGINAFGSGALILNGDTGTGGVNFCSGSAGTVVASVSNAGAASFNGTLAVTGYTTLAGVTCGSNLSVSGTLSVTGGAIYPWAGADTIPALASTVLNGEIHGRQSIGADRGFLRLSAGGETNPLVKTAIDLQGYGITDNAQMRFYTAGVERARFAPGTGNLLIGTTTDGGQTLQVAGTVAVSGKVSGALGGWTTWTPTLSGSGSMTISSVTVVDAQYLTIGPITYFKLWVNPFTTGGTASTTVVVTLPLASVGMSSPCTFFTANATANFSVGVAYVASNSSNLNLFLNGQTNWGLGTNQIFCEGFYRST